MTPYSTYTSMQAHYMIFRKTDSQLTDTLVDTILCRSISKCYLNVTASQTEPFSLSQVFTPATQRYIHTPSAQEGSYGRCSTASLWPKDSTEQGTCGDGQEGAHLPRKGTKCDYYWQLLPFLERGIRMLPAWEAPQAAAPGDCH